MRTDIDPSGHIPDNELKDLSAQLHDRVNNRHKKVSQLFYQADDIEYVETDNLITISIEGEIDKGQLAVDLPDGKRGYDWFDITDSNSYSTLRSLTSGVVKFKDPVSLEKIEQKTCNQLMDKEDRIVMPLSPDKVYLNSGSPHMKIHRLSEEEGLGFECWEDIAIAYQ